VMAISMLTVVGVLSFAQDIYADSIFFVATANEDLYEIDIPAGTSTLIGDMGVFMTDIALDPTTGNLWGITFTQLYSIDKTNANVVLIGSLGTGDSNALTFGDDGTLYEAGNSSTDLRTVDLTDGSTTVVGNIGFVSSGDLIWDASLDMLWFSSSTGSDSLVLIDPTTGIGALKGPFNFACVFGLGIEGGILYGTTCNGDLISIDTSDGSGTLVNPTVNAIFGATDDQLLVKETAWADGTQFTDRKSWAMYVALNVNCSDQVVTLFADQTIDVGTATLNCDGTDVEVVIDLTGGWDLVGSHLHTEIEWEDIPQTRSNNPKIGKFEVFGGPTDTTILVPGDVGFIAIHLGVETLQ